MPTVEADLVASEVACPTLVSVARPTTAPAAVTRAVNKIAIPVAVRKPKNAEPTLTPPCSSRSLLDDVPAVPNVSGGLIRTSDCVRSTHVFNSSGSCDGRMP